MAVPAPFLLAVLSLVVVTVDAGGQSCSRPANRSLQSGCTDCCKNVCLTQNCLSQAAQLSSFMDTSVNPCEDFPKFACGKFFKNYRIPNDEYMVSTLTLLEDKKKAMMKDIIMEDIKPTDRPYQRWPKMYFKSCMDTDQIEKIGLRPFLDSAYAKEWPTLIGRDWVETEGFSAADLSVRYARVTTESLFKVAVGRSKKNNTIYSIKVTGRSNFGIRQNFLKGSRNSSVVKAYERSLRDMAIELGAEPSLAAEDAATVLDMEITLAKLKEISMEKEENYHKLPLGSLYQNYSSFGLPQTIKAAFQMADITLGDDEPVILWDKNLNYFNSLDRFLQNHTERDLRLLFGFDYAAQSVFFTERMKDILFELNKVLVGFTERTSKQQECLEKVERLFGFSLSKTFLQRLYTEEEMEETKRAVEDMVENVRDTMLEHLQGITWMRNSTKSAAIEKVNQMISFVSYPDTGFDDDDFDSNDRWAELTEDNYYHNKELSRIGSSIANFRTLREAPTKEWSKDTSPHVVNGYHKEDENAIYILAGFLRAPIFSLKYLPVGNYGTIGSIIGHEIMHAFDMIGSQYDKVGNLINWWEDVDREKFMNASQCFIDQYDNFTYPQLRGMKASFRQNATRSVTEIVAEVVGVRLAYYTYKKIVAQNGGEQELPGLKLTSDQLFFLSYAHMWCGKENLAVLRFRLVEGNHPDPYYRVLAPLWNFPEFSKVFNCPAGSPMNPAKKCTLY